MFFNRYSILIIRFLALALLTIAMQAHAETVEIQTPAPPTINAKAFILQDFQTGKVLAENNADEKLAPGAKNIAKAARIATTRK